MEQDIQASENNDQVKNSVLFKKPKKKNNKKIVLLIGAIMVILGVALYFLFFSNKEDKAVPVLENEKVEETEIDKELDSDQDGLPDHIEEVIGTDVNNSDTDGDGYGDFEEIKNGYDPIGDGKYTEEEWETVKEEIRNEGLYKEIFGMEQEEDVFICGTTTVKDIDGNVYETVSMGTQCWLKENLKVTKNPAGDAITRYCYNNDSSICETDGGLYDWNTTMNGYANTLDDLMKSSKAQGICPDRWHIPLITEIYTLSHYLESIDTTCSGSGRYRSCDTARTIRLGGSSNFEGILAGHRDSNGLFSYRSKSTSFWSSSSYRLRAGKLYLSLTDFSVRPAGTDELYGADKEEGYSIRCLKD